MQKLSPMGAAALVLAQEYGWPVLPLHALDAAGRCSCGAPNDAPGHKPAKHPRIAGAYLNATTHPEQVAEWFDRWPTANIGVWPHPAGLVVIDVDSDAGADAARALGDDGRPTLESVTRRGAHRWFRLSAGVSVGNIARDDLDVRSARGYVVVAPSVHPSGHVYAWRGDLDAIADIPTALLDALIASDARHAARPAPSTRRFPVPSAPVHAPDRRNERRILAYADRLGYGRSDGRKTAAFVFAAFLIHDVGLDDGAAWGYLAAWNTANVPPIDDDTLMTRLVNARKYGGRLGSAA